MKIDIHTPLLHLFVEFYKNILCNCRLTDPRLSVNKDIMGFVATEAGLKAEATCLICSSLPISRSGT